MMQRKDIMIIVVVAIFAGIFSLVISKIFFTTGPGTLKAEKVQAISADFQKPDPAVFNDQAIDPTKLIQIGDSTNPQPF